MRPFTDAQGAQWQAGALEEDTPRHHGRWYLVLSSQAAPDTILALPQVRWQTAQSARCTLQTMSEFELHRRLRTALQRAEMSDAPKS